MKLRNKKTGEIVETDYMLGVSVPTTGTFGFKSYDQIADYDSLAKLNEEWEDYEEPKEYWYIDWNGEVCRSDIHDERTEQMKLIGNYFETEEEAEKAVEKLKAWKRLKDKGFRFDSYDVADRVGDGVVCGQVYFKAGNYNREEIENDLYLLFGGEECCC